MEGSADMEDKEQMVVEDEEVKEEPRREEEEKVDDKDKLLNSQITKILPSSH